MRWQILLMSFFAFAMCAHAQTGSSSSLSAGTNVAAPSTTAGSPSFDSSAGSPTYRTQSILGPGSGSTFGTSTFGTGSSADPNVRQPDAFGMTTGSGTRGTTTSPQFVPLYDSMPAVQSLDSTSSATTAPSAGVPSTTRATDSLSRPAGTDTLQSPQRAIQSVPVQTYPAPQSMSTPYGTSSSSTTGR